MFCTECGTPRQDQSDFCVRCGAQMPIRALPAPPSAPPAPPPAPPAPPVSPPVGAPWSDPAPAGWTGSTPRHPRGRRTAALIAAAVVLVAAAGGGTYLLTRPKSPPTSKTNAAATNTPAATSTSTSGASAPTSPPSSNPPVASFADLYKQTGDGVVRIETTACSNGGVGSGFLIAPDLVATVAHVVDGAVSIVVRQGTTSTTGTVVGFDRTAELALVRTSGPLSGHVFTLSATQPDVGADVAAIGYPLAGPESLSKGAISGLDRPIDTESGHHTGLLQTDVSINPGNSGGPLLLADGTVVGVVEAKDTGGDNIGFAVPSATARAQLQAWQQAPTPQRLAGTCAAPVGPSQVSGVVTDSSGSPDGAGIAQAFIGYTDGINRGDYAAAYAVLTPASQSHTSFAKFSTGTRSSYIVTLEVVSLSPGAAGRDTAEARFTSLQDPAQGGTGQSCSEWQMTYTMVQGGEWRIDNAKPHAGSPASC